MLGAMSITSSSDERSHAFVAMPFSEEFDPLHKVIAKAVKGVGLRPLRGNQIPRGGPFIENIFNAIEQAGLVIGVTSDGNPNVVYELGYAQHMNKEMILLAEDPEQVPADLRGINHLRYSADNLSTLGENLRRWLLSSNLLSSDSSQNRVLRRGDVFDTVVDGTFYLQKTRPAPSKAEIRDHLRRGLSMPQRLLYLTEEGQTTYLELCADPEYLYYQETVSYVSRQAKALVDTVRSHCDSSEIDFISLGPGNGVKDALLLDKFLKQAGDFRYTYYYPYDVSGGLLLEAMRNILGKGLPLEQLRVKAIEADVNYLGEFKRVFDYRSEPNVYSLLGGLANMEREVDLLAMLRRLMNPEDCLLLEVRKKTNAGDGTGEAAQALGPEDLNRRLDLAPLRYVGATVDPETVHYDEVTSTSTIPGTTTVAAVVRELRLPGDKSVKEVTLKDVSLFSVHYYDPAEVKRILQRTGFRVLLEHEQENSLFYICSTSRS